MTDHAQAIRAAWIRARDTRDNWIEATLDLAATLDAAKRDYPATQDFGQWCDVEVFYISRHDRAGLLRIGSYSREMARDIIDESSRQSWQTLGDLFLPRLPSPRNSDDEPESPANVDELAPPPVKKQEPPPTKVRVGGRVAQLAKKFGPPGLAISEKLQEYRKQHGWTGGLRLSSLLAEEIKRPQTIRKLADYLEQPGIPEPQLGANRLHAVALWPTIPRALAIRIHGHRVGEEALNLYLDKWADEIAPHYKAWCDAGKPRDVDGWFARRDKPQNVLPFAVPVLLNIPPRENYHSGFQPTDEGPIHVFGKDLWPAPQFAKWTFREAFYAYHLWMTIDGVLSRSEPRRRERARILMNPFTPILKNLSLGAGEAFDAILQQAFSDCDGECFAPAKKLVLQ